MNASQQPKPCAIWPEHLATEHQPYLAQRKVYYDSPRAGGRYQITSKAEGYLKLLPPKLESARIKARLTNILTEMRKNGDECPLINTDLIHNAANRHDLHPYERANRLLLYFSRLAPRLGGIVKLDNSRAIEAIVLSESIDVHEVDFLIRFLAERNLVQSHSSGDNVTLAAAITLAGHAFVADMQQAVDQGQAFVAMWFSDYTNDLFDFGIKPAIEAAGYKALRIDQKPDTSKIDDEIIAEIRRSRFIVADFTHGRDGARGGVYYEAGFAYGLGIPVIFTCHKGQINDIHFDTRQYNHILWEQPTDLVKPLADRIMARIGQGPN